MNASLRARSVYTSNKQAVRTPRSVEAQLIGEITAELQKASKAKDYPLLVSALHRNRSVWTTFAVDLADNKNLLPKTLRAQIFYLAEFTNIHSQKVLSGQADATPLVEINLAILKGLSNNGVSQ